MRNRWQLALMAALLDSFGCADLTSPEPLEVVVPGTLVVPMPPNDLMKANTVSRQLLPVGSIVLTPVARRQTSDIPPEYLQAAPVTGFTDVNFEGAQISGYGEMAFYANSVNQAMTISSHKNGSTLGSETFENGMAFPIPMGWSIGINGALAAPSCGGVATGKTRHTAKISYLVNEIFNQTITSHAIPRYQSACADTTSRGPGTGGGGDDGGYELIICTTTSYYSGSGQYLYSSRTCRTETHMI